MKDTQCNRILAYLQSGGSLTQEDARRLFRCWRLGARIHDLKRRGYRIESTLELHRNESGEYTKFARYALKEADA